MITDAVTREKAAIEQTPEPGTGLMKIHRDQMTPALPQAHAWAQASYALFTDTVSVRGQYEAAEERIASLEVIIAILIEKNERIRQQLIARA